MTIKELRAISKYLECMPDVYEASVLDEHADDEDINLLLQEMEAYFDCLQRTRQEIDRRLNDAEELAAGGITVQQEEEEMRRSYNRQRL